MIKIGDKLYISSEGYISHGEDDVTGGLATVSKIGTWSSDITFVCFEEVGNASQYNLEYILNHQKEWEENYKNKIAHCD